MNHTHMHPHHLQQCHTHTLKFNGRETSHTQQYRPWSSALNNVTGLEVFLKLHKWQGKWQFPVRFTQKPFKDLAGCTLQIIFLRLGKSLCKILFTKISIYISLLFSRYAHTNITMHRKRSKSWHVFTQICLINILHWLRPPQP